MTAENPFNDKLRRISGAGLEVSVGAAGALDTTIFSLMDHVFSPHQTVLSAISDRLNESIDSIDPVGWAIKNILTATNEAGINPNITLGFIMVISTALMADGLRRLKGELKR